MCFDIMKNELMVRINPDFYAQALQMNGCKSMDFTGRILKGFLLISPEGIDREDDLDFWLQKCLDFNPSAK